MNEIALSSVQEIIKELNMLPNGYIFRGQAEADWRLESSLERVLGDHWTPSQARKFEDYGLAHFKPKFHLYDDENLQPTSTLEWLSLMQHYGAPTRLLDFTESPFVALYFALEAINPSVLKSKFNSKMAIYALNYSQMMDASLDYIRKKDASFSETKLSLQTRQDEVFDQIVDRFSYPIAWATEPQRVNKRLDRQSGCFLVAGDRGLRIEEILSSAIYKEIELTKFVIPVRLIDGLYALLRKMNINSKSIYGDLQGLCRAIRMEMQIYVNPVVVEK